MTELESPEIAVVREFSGSVARMAKEILRIREDRLRSVATWSEELERVKAETERTREINGRMLDIQVDLRVELAKAVEQINHNADYGMEQTRRAAKAEAELKAMTKQYQETLDFANSEMTKLDRAYAEIRQLRAELTGQP